MKRETKGYYQKCYEENLIPHLSLSGLEQQIELFERRDCVEGTEILPLLYDRVKELKQLKWFETRLEQLTKS